MNQLVQTAIIYRGTILQEMSIMELVLNQYIAEHFCGDNDEKIAEMHVLILGDERISLSNKVQIFNAIRSTEHKEWISGYTSSRQPQAKNKPYSLIQDLNFVVEHRNIFAHRVLDGDLVNIFAEKEEKAITLIKMKNDVSSLEYTEDFFKLIVRVIIDIRNFLATDIKPNNIP